MNVICAVSEAARGAHDDRAQEPGTVLLVLYDGMQSLDVMGMAEVFSRAAPRRSADDYRFRTASLGARPARSSCGLVVVPDEDLRTVPMSGIQTLLVPGSGPGEAPGAELRGWLRGHAGLVRRLAAVGTAAGTLAEAGLLDQRQVTAHDADRLRPGEPADCAPGTAAGAPAAGGPAADELTAGVELALSLVADDIGDDAALAVAGQLVPARSPGTPQLAQLRMQSARRTPLRQLQRWIDEHPAADLSVSALAGRSGLSPRQFTRVFTAETGITPGQYVDQVRLDAARRRLEATGENIEQVARTCGYGTPETMRRAFVRRLGLPPGQYRRQH